MGRILLAVDGLVIAVSMALDIGLGTEIDAILVTEVVPAWVVRIMTCADSVEIELLQALYIAYHTLCGDYISLVRVKLMTVDALEEDSLAIDEELSVTYLDSAESDAVCEHLDRLCHLLSVLLHISAACLGRLCCHDLCCESVEIWCLGTPQGWVCYKNLCRATPVLGLRCCLGHCGALCVSQLVTQCRAACDVSIDCQTAIGIGCHLEVVDMYGSGTHAEI